jgi:penicillin-binding protein 2
MNIDIRKYIIQTAIVVVGLILISRFFYLQVIDTSGIVSANNNSRRLVTQYPARGLILDRNGNTIVDNEATFDLMVIPGQLRHFDTIALANLIGIAYPELKNIFATMRRSRGFSNFRPQLLMRQMSVENYALFCEQMYKYPGLFVQPRTLRNYVRSIAPHVLGYVTEVDSSDIRRDGYYRSGDYIGRSGIERFYEEELRGRKGVKMQLVDVHNRIVGSFLGGRMDTTAVVGSNLTITIDADLQEYVESLMANMRGAAVAIEPSTGEILAMVSVPTYDPALLVGRARSANFSRLRSDVRGRPLFDRATMAPYPPGSVFKIAQGLVGLQEETITANTAIGCGGAYVVGSFSQRCRGHFSPVNLTQAVGVSCNTFFAVVFRQMLDNSRRGTVRENYEVWRNDIRSFGFGQRLGVDLPQELNGNVPSLEYYDRLYFPSQRWRSLTIVSLSIGQAEMGTTVLQMANFAALIANGGYFYTPRLIKQIDGRDTIPPRYATRNYTAVDTAHFKPVRDGMRAAVTSGTAWTVAINGIELCGKTGTSENPHGRDHSTFIAFAPKDNPKIAVAVYVENSGFGSVWAAPVASLMIEKYLTGEVTRKHVEDRMRNFDIY